MPLQTNNMYLALEVHIACIHIEGLYNVFHVFSCYRSGTSIPPPMSSQYGGYNSNRGKDAIYLLYTDKQEINSSARDCLRFDSPLVIVCPDFQKVLHT